MVGETGTAIKSPGASKAYNYIILASAVAMYCGVALQSGVRWATFFTRDHQHHNESSLVGGFGVQAVMCFRGAPNPDHLMILVQISCLRMLTSWLYNHAHACMRACSFLRPAREGYLPAAHQSGTPLARVTNNVTPHTPMCMALNINIVHCQKWRM